MRTVTAPVPRICPASHHSFSRITGTVAGDEVAVTVLCVCCNRTIEQVMDQQPEELERYRAWVASGEAEV